MHALSFLSLITHRATLIALCLLSTAVTIKRNLNVQTSQPLAVVTHGLRMVGEEDVPDWAKATLRIIQEQGARCVLMDWTDESNDTACGWAESAGDELFARLAWEAARSDAPLEVRLIGHSRGAVVNSEADRRLAFAMYRWPQFRRRFTAVHVTMLDPHPANAHTQFSTNCPSLAAIVSAFARRADDPAARLWPHTDSAAIFYQHAEVAADEAPTINPFGIAEWAAPPGCDLVATDLTGRKFEAPEGET